MKAIDLNGLWTMEQLGSEEQWPAEIPGSVASTLLAHGQIVDPYFRDNEHKILPVFDEDYSFSRRFKIDENILSCDKVLLHCDGLDTLADITVNGSFVANANNMHRTWIFDVKDLLIEGENIISILFRSPTKFLEANPSRIGKPFSSIRKAACTFGWDWGLNLPDSGIWRDIYIETHNVGRIDHVDIRQIHHEGAVQIKVTPQCEIWGDAEVTVQVTSPKGELLIPSSDGGFLITSPELWWPVGYGDQPLYEVKTVLFNGGEVFDEKVQQIGLRTIEHNREQEGDGSKYEFIVNGTPIFFRGENLIIEDSIISRIENSRLERLIDNSLKSNLNGIRVWGGAYYPPGYFYELCDKHGLLIFQDFMFACTFYATNEQFLQNVQAEVTDNLKRIYHHPSIGLYCGNNEIDGIYTVAGSTEPETVALRKMFGSMDTLTPEVKAYIWGMYSQVFLDIIPKACAEYAPDTAYVHSSPSVKEPGTAQSFFDYLSDGDMHYYLQYNENAPYEKMRSFRSRFMTEIGFQSYPSLKTIRAFTDEEDRTPYTPVMYSHQKCKNGNETIEIYMERDYIVPTDFEDYVHLSQLQAGEIMRYSVEHMRRDSSYCRGMILWQLNDCWPVVSWSGIDYYGRWKALQYFIKRFYAPVLISALDEGTTVGLWVTNDTPNEFKGNITWKLWSGSTVLKTGEDTINALAGSSNEYIHLDFTDVVTEENKGNMHLEYELNTGNESVGHGTLLFVLPKEFAFEQPTIQLETKETEQEYQITVAVDCYTKGIALDTLNGDCIFSDNWFDLSEGESKLITISKKDAPTLKTLQNNLVATSLNHIMLAGKRVE